MDLGLKNKTAIVTGASGGLGRCCAEMLAAEGVNLVICSKNYEKIFAAARSISETFGSDVVPIAADIYHMDSSEKLVNEALRKFNSIDILINNTGISSPGKFDENDEKELEKSFNISLMSSIRMVQSVLPHMTTQKWGRIINISTSVTNHSFPGAIFAHSFKTAIIDLSRTLSLEVSSKGVLINTILAGNFDTESFRADIKKASKIKVKTEKEIRHEIESAIPIGRIGNLEELAWVITFLAGEKSSYITGTTIHVG
ncbi:SDR family oxidoreductase [Candidatus Latescibacterota bacterium]